jgi:hypothetical protein
MLWLLEGYVNACRLLLNPENKNWFYGEPIGIHLDPTTSDERDQGLVWAYSFLALPISCPAEWAIPDSYNLQEARASLLSEERGSEPNRLSFPVIEELPGDDYDALMFSDVRPDYPEHRYMADGTRRTKQQRKDYDEGESSDMVNATLSAGDESDEATFPPEKIKEVMEDIQPTGAPTLSPLEDLRLAVPEPSLPSKGPVLQLDIADSLAPPGSISNPASAPTSAPTSAISSAFSSASSLNAPSHSRRGTPHQWRGRAARRQQCANEYPGSSRPPLRAQASRETWDQYFGRQEASGVSYDSRNESTTHARSAAIVPRSDATNVGFVQAAPQFRVLGSQAQPMLLHDTSSNQLVETTILSTDFSQSAVLQRVLHPGQPTPGRSERSPPREQRRSPPRASGSRNRSRNRRHDYPRRSPSREYSRCSPSPDYRQRSTASRRRSPVQYSRDRSPPRERYQGSRRHSPPARSARLSAGTEGVPPLYQQSDRHMAEQTLGSERDGWYASAFLNEGPNQGWGASSPTPQGPAEGNSPSANPSTSRNE